MNTGPTIGIDIGGTFIKGGLLEPGRDMQEIVTVPTGAAEGPRSVVERVVDLVARVCNGHRAAEALGVGCPGPLSHETGVIHETCNMPGWDNYPLRDTLAAETGLPVTLDNDGNVAAYGELVAGAGMGARNIVMLTLGTGVGGGVIVDGQLVRGQFHNAAEIGHSLVQLDGRPCPCGQRGCLERYASASAMADRVRDAIADGTASVLAGKAHLTSKHVAEAARAGDPLAQRVWDEGCRYLAMTCVNLQHLLNPERILMAGGLSRAGDQLIEPVRRYFDEMSWSYAGDRPRIELAALGGDAGVVGAAALARDPPRRLILPSETRVSESPADLMPQALDYLRRELGPRAQTLGDAGVFDEAPLDGEGRTVLFTFDLAPGSGATPCAEQDRRHFIACGDTTPNYFPAYGLTPDQAYSFHVGTRFMLGMQVQKVDADLEPPTARAALHRFVENYAAGVPIESEELAALFRCAEEYFAVYRLSLGGRDVYCMGAGSPPGFYEMTRYPPQATLRLHLGNVIRAEAQIERARRAQDAGR